MNYCDKVLSFIENEDGTVSITINVPREVCDEILTYGNCAEISIQKNNHNYIYDHTVCVDVDIKELRETCRCGYDSISNPDFDPPMNHKRHRYTRRWVTSKTFRRDESTGAPVGKLKKTFDIREFGI